MKKSVKILGVLAGAGLAAAGIFGLMKGKDEEYYVDEVYDDVPENEETEDDDDSEE